MGRDQFGQVGTLHEHIVEVYVKNSSTPWLDGWFTVEAVHDAIKKGQQYVVLQGIRTVAVEARTTPFGHKFIQTKADGVFTNNLLALPIG